MSGDEAAVVVIDALEALAIPYMVVGSFSSNVYGVARSTHDADFVVEMDRQRGATLANRLGPQFRFDPQKSFETVTGTTRQIVSVVGTEFVIQLFDLSDDAHDQERFGRRRRANLSDRAVWLPTAEDVVITKLRWASRGGRPKDRDDARNVITIQGGRLDWPYIESWCDRHGSRALLDEIRRAIPPG